MSVVFHLEPRPTGTWCFLCAFSADGTPELFGGFPTMEAASDACEDHLVDCYPCSKTPGYGSVEAELDYGWDTSAVVSEMVAGMLLDRLPELGDAREIDPDELVERALIAAGYAEFAVKEAIRSVPGAAKTGPTPAPYMTRLIETGMYAIASVARLGQQSGRRVWCS
jgi:hypothetical protein